MKTSPTAAARPLTTPRARLLRLAAVGLVAPVVALGACSAESPVAADATAPAPSGTPSGAGTTTAPTTPTSTTTDAVPVDKRVGRDIRAVITDPDLGHTITATSVIRHIEWPTGRPVSARQFEIVGVSVTLSAGSRYSASIDPSMLSLIAASPSQTIKPTSEFNGLWGAPVLKSAGRSQTTRGWVFFKVDRGTTSSLKLAFNRPAYEVSTTGKNIPAKTFTTVLAK